MMDREENTITNTAEAAPARFRWTYIAVPVIILILSLILIAFFFGRLPASTAYLFNGEGLPGKEMSRLALILWLIGIQALFVLAAAGVTLGISGIYNRYAPQESDGISRGTIIGYMGNMVAVPQIILFIAMLDIFSYNSYQTHLLPFWLNAIIVLFASGIFLGIFFLRSALQVWRAYKE